ncbi:MAG: glucose-1-phosphate adenylyltransferase family protein [Dehalococcoidales bacterium]|nr:glucose-1-phosphate adenylyltransferase family protein [Dehalococcoidales bacterium]
MTKTLAVVLAGGRGKKMDILCHTRPKPTLPFAAGFRIVDFSLSNCVHSGIKNIAVLTDYQRLYMAHYFNQWKLANGSSLIFDILEPQKGSYKGTADAVYQNLDYLRKHDAEAILILAGDHVYKMDYRKMLTFHEKVKADVTLGVVTVPIEETCRFSTVRVAPDSRITDFVEKSGSSQSNLASMGIYLFNKQVLIKRLSEDAARPDSPHDFGYAILPEMMRRDKVFAYQFKGYWQDIDTKKAYYDANMEFIKPQPSFSLNSHWNVLSVKQDLLSVMKPNRGVIENSLVSPGCIVKGRVENSILSPGVRVEEQAVVRNSILMSDVSVGYHSMVDRCILDEGVDIGRYCYIGFGTGLSSEAQGITVIGKDATIPEHTAIGRDCTVLPKVQPADFRGSAVPSGSTLLPAPTGQRQAGEKVKVKQL